MSLIRKKTSAGAAILFPCELIHRNAVELPDDSQPMVHLETAQRLSRTRSDYSVNRTGLVPSLFSSI
jgi:hypothetical protein